MVTQQQFPTTHITSLHAENDEDETYSEVQRHQIASEVQSF